MSKGEEIIKELLEKKNIKFVREHPFLIKEHRNGKEYMRIWHPDFWLPELGIMIEYFGMIRDDNYKKGVDHKKETYKRLHIECIPVYPKTLNKNYEAYIMKSISRILTSRKRVFHDGLKGD